MVVVCLVFFWIFKNRQWKGNTRFNVIKLANPIVFEGIDPIKKLGIRVTLANNLNIESVNGRGIWLSGKIGQVGEKKWVADSVAGYLGIAYDAIWENMNWWDRIAYENWKKKVRWNEIDLKPGDSMFVTEEKQPDGVVVGTLNGRFEKWAIENFSDTALLTEALSVSVVNSTQTLGMGTYASRMIESRGIRVASVESGSEVVECILKGDKEILRSLTANFISKWFGCKLEESEKKTHELELVLGQTFREWWKGL
jgi:hypothetical protein